MPLKTGTYTMTFMLYEGEPPFPISTNATMNIATTTPSLTGTISVPALGISGASFQGTAADNPDGTTSFEFTATSTPVLEAYGMQFVCGTDKKLIGGMNISSVAGPTATDPGADACWVATHSVGAGGDEDGDDKRGGARYGD